ncbi:MAG: glycosyltransferase, partial [Gemmatimonadales bacterium]
APAFPSLSAAPGTTNPGGEAWPSLLAPDARAIDLARTTFPPVLRPDASLGLLDITKYFGDATGGIRTYLLQKARYVQRHPEFRQVLVVPGAGDSLTQSNGVRCYRLRGPRIPTQEAYRFLLATRTTRRILEHERPDLIEIGSPLFVPWLTRHANRRLGAPLVWFYHTNLPRILAPLPARWGPRRLASNLAWHYVRRLAANVSATLVASDTVRSELEREGVERVVTVSLGVELDRFTPARRDHTDATRAAMGLPAGPIAMFVGRLAREKHLDVVLAAWRTVERRTEATLVLVGDGPARAMLQGGSAARRVRWLPYQTDRDRLADLLAAADLYIAPGPAETFGLAALEALASGTPVLSVDRGGVSELVLRSGAGALYPCRDSSALAEAAIRLLSSDLRSLGARGRSYAEARHAWDGVFDRTFGVYRGLLR